MPKSVEARIVTHLENILDGIVKIKEIDGPLSPRAKARLKVLKAMVRKVKRDYK